MCRHQRMLEMYIGYRRGAEKKAAPEPKRIIFYRGTSMFYTRSGAQTDRCRRWCI